MKLVTTIIAMMCLVSVASADDYKHSEDVASGGATVFGFAGERVNFECYSDAADCIFKVQHRIATTWTDFQPADTSPSDTVRLLPVFRGRGTSDAQDTRPQQTPLGCL